MQLVLNNHQFTNHHEMCQMTTNMTIWWWIEHNKQVDALVKHKPLINSFTWYTIGRWNNVTHKCVSMWNSQRVDEMMTVIETEIDWLKSLRVLCVSLWMKDERSHVTTLLQLTGKFTPQSAEKQTLQQTSILNLSHTINSIQPSHAPA